MKMRMILLRRKKNKKKKYLKIFGKKVMHKWTHQDKDHWHLGVVTAVLDEDEQDSECEFCIQYDSDHPDETYDLKLLKYKTSGLVINGDADGSKATPTATSMPSQVNSSPVTPGNSSDGNTHKSFEIIKSTKIANSETAENWPTKIFFMIFLVQLQLDSYRPRAKVKYKCIQYPIFCLV